MNHGGGVVINNPQRGEIWQVSFDPAKGEEIQKTRPAVVVNLDSIGRLGLRIIVPVTGWSKAYQKYIWMVPLTQRPETGLSKPSGADSSQVKSLSVQRLKKKLGTVTAQELDDIAAAIALCVGYNP
jgi:mRNA interferase MazF